MPCTLDELVQMSQQHLVGCHPVFSQRVIAYVTSAYNNGLYFAVQMGERTWAQQAALFAQGRTAPGPRVTKAQAGDSAHNYGIAADLVEDGDPNKAGIQWSWSNNADYLKMGSLAKDCGLEWGGLWKSFKDYPHVSLTCGMSVSQAKLLYNQGGKPAVWAELDRRLAAGIIGSGW